MEELDILKKDWKKREKTLPKLSYDEIYNMLWKKSSSIVKWIFYISLIEFAFWSILSYLLKDTEGMKRFDSYNADHIYLPLMIIGYLILFYFIYMFFMNYKKISVTDDAKTLMKNIIKTRKTVKQYVWFNIIYLVISSLVVAVIQLNYDSEIAEGISKAAANGKESMFIAAFIGIVFVFSVVVAALIWLLYRLIYGILLKRLHKNYQELKQMEV